MEVLDTVKAEKSTKITASLWTAFIICLFANIFGGCVSTLMSVYLPVTVKDILGDVSEQRFNDVSGWISALYIVGWMVGGFVSGVLSDSVGRSKALILCIVIFGAATLGTRFAGNWEMLVAARLLTGFGVGGVLVISPVLLAEIFPRKLASVFIGIISIGFPIGIALTGLISYVVPSAWRTGFMIGILPLGLAVLSIYTLRESEKWKTSKTDIRQVPESIFSQDHLASVIKGSIIFGAMLIGLWAVFSWVPTWVTNLIIDNAPAGEEHPVLDAVGISMMLLGISAVIGGFVSGWITNVFGVRKAMFICFSGCAIMCGLLFGFTPRVTLLTYVEIVVLGLFFGFSQGCLSVYIPILFPTSIRATATGFCFNVSRLFTAAAVFFVGSLVIKLGGFSNSLLVFSSIFLVGLLAVILIKETPEEAS